MEKKLALGIIEFGSVPTGYKITNEILKNYRTIFFDDKLISRGKYVALLMDSYENIEDAINYGISKESNNIIDIGLIGNVHKDLQGFLDDNRLYDLKDIIDLAVIKVETFSSCIETANKLLHFSNIKLIDLIYKDSLNGDCLIIISGNTSNLMVAIEKIGYGEILLNPDKRILNSILEKRGCN